MIKQSEKGIIFPVRIIPNSSKNDLIFEDSYIKVKVTAQPIENKANKALVVFLSKFLDIPKTSIEIIKGTTSKDKTLCIKVSNTILQADIIKKLTK